VKTSFAHTIKKPGLEQAKIVSINKLSGRVGIFLRNGLVSTATYLYDIDDLRVGASVLVNRVSNTYVIMNKVSNMPRAGVSYSLSGPPPPRRVSLSLSALTSFPFSILYGACDILSDTLYSGFGRQYGTWPQNFYACDIATGVWTSRNANIYGRESYTIVCAPSDGRVYLGNGQRTSNDYRKDWYAYTPETNTWAVVSDFVYTGTPCIGFYYNGYIYVGAGFNRITIAYDKRLFRLNTSNPTGGWEYVCDLPSNVGVAHSAYCIVGNLMYIGNMSEDSVFSNAWYCINLDSLAITNLADSPVLPAEQRYFMLCFYISGDIFLGGGRGYDGIDFDWRQSFYRYNIIRNSWTSLGDMDMQSLGIDWPGAVNSKIPVYDDAAYYMSHYSEDRIKFISVPL
jgi:hypothetical protein